MKKSVSIWLLLLFVSFTANSQYYLRGEIKDEVNNPLTNAKIILNSTGYVYYTGNSGGFGIMSNNSSDSIIIAMDGFVEKRIKVFSNQYEYITLKKLKSTGNTNEHRLISFTKNLTREDTKRWSVGGETYTSLIENNFIDASKFPETGFAFDIDKASYSNIRRFINMPNIVPPDAVRVEEMLNYFNFEYVAPGGDSIFHFDPMLTECPWNSEHQLLFLKGCAKKVNMDNVPPSNLVFLIDVSGSMDMPNRLPLLKSAFKLMVNNLRTIDTISIVVYGGNIGVWLTPTGGDDKKKIIKAIEELTPGGSTPGESGILQAYRLAKSKFIPKGNNRIILATDGDFNVGQTSDEDLERLISNYKQSGIYLTCLGVGMGNYKDSKLEALSKKGNGNFAYLDNENEAQKVLVKELTQTLYTVADDAFMGVKFNPKYVKQYRLIGFDNKKDAISDTTSELEGGDVGSGQTLMAVFEIEPVVGAITTTNGDNNSMNDYLETYINYRHPKDSLHCNARFNLQVTHTTFNQMPACYRFAASVVMFGELLKESAFTKSLTWNQIFQIADTSKDPTDMLQVEFVTLVDKARKLYNRGKKRKSQD